MAISVTTGAMERNDLRERAKGLAHEDGADELLHAIGHEKPLTDRQVETLRDVHDGKVSTTDSYYVLGARADVLGRLEERELVYVDWDDPVNPRARTPALRTRCRVKITHAGYAALREAAAEARA